MVAVLIIGYGVSSNAYVCIPYYAPLSFQVTDADQKISESTETLMGVQPGKTTQHHSHGSKNGPPSTARKQHKR
jgi:hypothetical protein